MILDFINGLETILGNWATYSTLAKPTVYKYERIVEERMPSILLLPESTAVVSREAGAEILESSILVVFTLRFDQKTLPQKLYEYEESIRKCIWNQKLFGGNHYKVTTIEYGMSYTTGSVRLKNMIVTVIAQGEHNYV